MSYVFFFLVAILSYHSNQGIALKAKGSQITHKSSSNIFFSKVAGKYLQTHPRVIRLDYEN